MARLSGDETRHVQHLKDAVHGNELVAVYRIRVSRQIGSAALVADGLHARTDGFTSLAVAAGAVGVMLGFPLADPIVGILVTLAILAVLRALGCIAPLFEVVAA